MLNKTITTQTWRGNLFLSLTTGLSLFAGILLASNVASAQTLQLRFLFDDTGPGTTTTSDASGALGTGVTLLMETSAGVATNLHGVANSGVQNQGGAIDFSSNPISGNNNGNIAYVTNDAAIGSLGLVSNFTATIWVKLISNPTNTANQAPRIFVIGTNGVTAEGAANSIGLVYTTTQAGSFSNAIGASINTSGSTPIPIYYPFPANIWQFFAVVYDAGNSNELIYYGTEGSPAKLVSVRNIGAQTVDFGSSGTLFIGSRLNGRNRGVKGSLDDFRFYTGVASAATIESIRQESTPVVISSLYPDGMSLLQGTNTLTFTASSANNITPGNIKVAVNGTDVSSSLVVGGTSTSRTVSYTGLPVDPTLVNSANLNAVKIDMMVTDDSGIIASNRVVYDAFSPDHFTWETEDYDFGSGQYIDNPTYAFTVAANTYFDPSGSTRDGIPPVDYTDNINTSGPLRVYRDPNGLVETEFSIGGGPNGGVNVGELMRQKVLNAFALDSSIREVNVGFFDGGTGSGLPNRMNYTRTFPAGLFNIYARVGYGGAGGASTLAKVTDGWGTGAQTITNLGTFTLNNLGGWQSYQWVPLRNTNGNLVQINLSGTNTLQSIAGAGGGGNQNFFMLVTANTNLPIILNIYPNAGLQPSGTFSFTARSPGGITINPNSINVALSGVPLSGSSFATNLTSANGLVITGTATNRNVVYSGLQTNVTYRAIISLVDVNGSPAGQTINFDTYNPILTWEGEDYNYGDGSTTGGLFFDNPQTNRYANLLGTPEIDYHEGNGNGTTSYRDDVAVGPTTEPASDTVRGAYDGTGFSDYDLGFYDGGDWVNYTRTMPAGDYNIYLRAANGGGANGGLALARIGGNPTTTSQTPTNLGTFTIPPTGGWQTYTFVPLRDAGGNLVKFTGGGVQTLRGTSSGGVNANYYALFAANTNLPTINNIYPNGVKLFQGTNRLSFSTGSTVGVSTNSITMTLNAIDVTSSLVITGSSTNRSVSYTGLQLSSNYVAVLTVIDLNGNVATTTVSFDTWAPPAYSWEAEDYDYGGGLFFDNPQTNAYAGLSNAVPEVDFHDVNANSANAYRGFGGTDTASTEGTGDGLRNPYDSTGFTDYNVGFFAPGAWGNYTRHYPAGSYNVYGRLACGNAAGTTIGLSEVTGFGTDPQTTNFLGTFAVPGSAAAWQAYNYIPLRDGSGNLVKLTLTGSTNTFKVSNEGPQDCNLNFLMLVSVASPLTLSAVHSGSNINISFLSQSGFSYQVEYKNNLTDVSWTPLGSPIVGDGTTKSFSDPASGSQRFYRVRIQ